MHEELLVTRAEDIFTKTKKNLVEMLELYNSINPIDVDSLVEDYENDNNKLSKLKDRWIKSLETDAPDYSVYADMLYLNVAYLTWINYSRTYCTLLKNWIPNHVDVINPNEISSVLDLGCGIAYTTIALSSIFPNAHIYGTNEPNTPQLEFDKLITKSFANISIVDNFNAGEHIDVVFASDFFEHINAPIDFLTTLIEIYSPKYFIFANTFTKMDIGHFYSYDVDGVSIPGKQMPRVFSKTLRDYGYCKIKTNFFNNRPNIYKLNSTKATLFNCD